MLRIELFVRGELAVEGRETRVWAAATTPIRRGSRRGRFPTKSLRALQRRRSGS